jgi:hypothetical protein
MNEQTAKLVEQLAKKLGTTADYLWSVLLKQAPISALTDLIYFVLISISGYFLLKVHKTFSKEDEHGDSKYYDNDALAPIMITLTFIWAILFIVSFFSIGNVINGFLNPEYWALDEILSSLKPD